MVPAPQTLPRQVIPHARQLAWIDATAGVAGDMLLGALIDAGAPVQGIQAALDAVLPGQLEITSEEVTRGAVRACHARVLQVGDRSLERTWPTIRDLLEHAPLAEVTRGRALATFERLARAEARVHGATSDSVHFHEVGALDAIGDVVGVCEALRLLGVTDVSASWVALGNGRIHAAHGLMPVPAPAVLELSRGWQVRALPGVLQGSDLHHDHHHPHEGGHVHGNGAHEHEHTHDHGNGAHEHSHTLGDGEHAHEHTHRLTGHVHEEVPALVGDPHDVGELATPTGMALIRALARGCEEVPALSPTLIGTGAGGRDLPGWANCVRVIIGSADDSTTDPAVGGAADEHAPLAPSDAPMVELRANLDDIDHRLLPGVLDACLELGAVDAWFTPIQMKKGRPAVMLQVLAPARHRQRLVNLILTTTPTLGVRESPVTRTVLERVFVTVDLDGEPLTVKVGIRDSAVVHAQAEFCDLADIARRSGRPELDIAQRAAAAIISAGLTAGAPAPVPHGTAVTPASGRTPDAPVNEVTATPASLATPATLATPAPARPTD